jgi:hypothetical protein
MKAFARLTAVLGLASLFAVTALAQAPTPPAMHAGKSVKSYTRKTKSGKVVTVKGYTRKAPGKKAVKTVAVKSYTRKMKNGKVVAVKGYTRKATMKKK